MPQIYHTIKTLKNPEEYLLMAAWALENRDRFDPNTVMDVALQSIRNYLADRAQRVVHTCTQCGRKTLDPIYIKHPDAHNPYCPECAAAFSNAMSHPAERVPDPAGEVRQG